MSTIYFHIMGSNERKASVEIRPLGGHDYAYEITTSYLKNGVRGHIISTSPDELTVITHVLNDFKTNFTQPASPPTEKL